MVRKYNYYIKKLQEINSETITFYLAFLLKSKSTELASLDEELPINIEKIMSFIKDIDSNITTLKNQKEEYKRLQIGKDNEISRLNDKNSSLQNEIEKYKKIIDEQKNGSREKQLEEEYKKEKGNFFFTVRAQSCPQTVRAKNQGTSYLG